MFTFFVNASVVYNERECVDNMFLTILQNLHTQEEIIERMHENVEVL